MSHQFLLYNNMDQLQAYMYASILDLPPTHPLPTLLGHHRELSRSRGDVQPLPTSCLSYIWQREYVSATPSVCPTLSFPLCAHKSDLCVCIYSCPANRFISVIFLDDIYMHQYMVGAFLFLAYITLYDKPQPHHYHYRWLSFVPFVAE